MNLIPDDKLALSNSRMERAREFLDDARANLAEGRIRTAVNRSYYAAMMAARSLLILDGVNPESHEGLVTMLSLRFVKTGQLPVSAIKEFRTLMVRRTDVDYGDFETVDRADAEDSCQVAAAFLDELEAVRQRSSAQLRGADSR